MDYYLELTLRPDPEFAPTVLMTALYNKLHRGLVQLGTRYVGVSFPHVNEAKPALGEIMRLHGEVDELERLMATNWLNGIRDHVTMSQLAPVRKECSYRVVRRVQAKSNPERLRRRRAMRKGISLEQARELIPDTAATHLKLPFVRIRSQSTGHTFPLFIEHMPLIATKSAGEFGCYGLSAVAAVPWF